MRDSLSPEELVVHPLWPAVAKALSGWNSDRVICSMSSFQLWLTYTHAITAVREGIPLFELGEPMWPAALAHYFFAASGGDSFARMALGYRHMQGLGVPRSCQTAVLYYQPVAEQVVELARTPNSLPYVSCFPCPAVIGCWALSCNASMTRLILSRVGYS